MKWDISREDIVEHALEIAKEYRGHGLVLTLRQMYYQFVARGLGPSSSNTYDRIGAALTAARYAGDFPVGWLEDRGRTIAPGEFVTSRTNVDRALRTAAEWLPQLPSQLIRRDRWFGQPVHCSVWIEKEALAGIFEPVCDDLGVSWFACKGYPSVSALHCWLECVAEAAESGHVERAAVLYFGDHDPDGFEIPRSADRNLERLRWLTALKAYPDVQIEFTRVALNMDQVEEYDPPPFEAKMTSARYQGYRDEHDTDDAWELDALEPTVLQGLIRDEVEDLFDDDVWRANESTVAARRAELLDRMRAPGWAAEALGD